MSAPDIEEMGPIDYVVLEWPGRQPSGEVAPLIVDLVERGIIRVLDVAVMAKDEEGHVAAIDLGALDDRGFAGFEAPHRACSARRTSTRRRLPSSPAHRRP